MSSPLPFAPLMARQQRQQTQTGGRRRRGLTDRGRPRKYTRINVEADRLQGPEPAAALHLRPRQDPLPPRHRTLPEAPAAARAGREARPRARPAALRRRALEPMAQAVLLKDVEGLGEAGTAIDVSPGYLRNYLVPRKLAQPATKGVARGGAAQAREAPIEAAKQAAERAGETSALLSKTVLTINHRAGEDGKLFGSVTSAEIADAIQASPRASSRPEEDPPRRPDPRDRHLHGRRRGRRRSHRLGQDDRRRGEGVARKQRPSAPGTKRAWNSRRANSL